MTTKKENPFARRSGAVYGGVGDNRSHHESGVVWYTLGSGDQAIGTFAIRDEMISVQCGDKKKVTQIGGMNPLTLAEALLSEIAREAA